MKYSSILIAFFLLLGCKGEVDKEKKVNQGIVIEPIDCVDRIFQKDSVLGDIRNYASEKISLSETIDNYTNGLQSLDYTDCPDKFRSAFQEHIQAWLNIKIVSDNYPSLRGELHDIFAELEKSSDSIAFKSLVKQIWDSWKMVEEQAR